eukprot:NODE_1108_length_1698_cov_40.710127_g981_i0.p1 GENE.NODE_1108_length_1698_cov_40.710127_g981_i0~~NODE_1108_length_1698_cov_40.710127_g981_i0.p1  ORF type:complete len:491 (+),score=85.15 NODE_1108_length_1698_cov_40.710127_g981_i0:40-1473(+)
MQRFIRPTLSAKHSRLASLISATAAGKLQVPNHPTIPFIEGDGCGPDIWRATRHVLDAAVAAAYGSDRSVDWLEVYAGEKAYIKTGEWLPAATLDALAKHIVSIKGPLATPFDDGKSKPLHSLQATLRQALDLYASIRPRSYIDGVPSPMVHPEWVNAVIFRDTTEDVYAGIEFPAGSAQANSLTAFLGAKGLGGKVRFPKSTGYGIKPVSREGSQRLIRAAIEYALANKSKNVVLVHKGNIMKFTEGGFKDWGYALATSDYRSQCVTERESWILDNFENGATDHKENAVKLEPGFDMMTEQQQNDAVAEVKGVIESIGATHGNGRWKELLLIRDTIADITLQQIMTRTEEFDVIATTTLNGSYLSEALAAQVGGVGIVPGYNVNFETGCAMFEAIHGTAPKYANLDKVNPSGLILTGSLMLKYLGWNEASALVEKGLRKTISSGKVTYDLKRLMGQGEATELKCSEFGKAIVQNFQ